MSRTAPAAAVSSAASSKQKRSASGSTPDSLPTSTTIRLTRAPALRRTAMATTSSAMDSSCMERLAAEAQDHLDRAIDGGRDRRAEGHDHLLLVAGGRFAADQDEAGQAAAQLAGQGQHLDRLHAVRLDDGLGRSGLALDGVQGPGRTAAARSVDQDDGVVAVEEGVGEVEAADAEVD